MTHPIFSFLGDFFGASFFGPPTRVSVRNSENERPMIKQNFFENVTLSNFDNLFFGQYKMDLCLCHIHIYFLLVVHVIKLYDKNKKILFIFFFVLCLFYLIKLF